MITVAVCFFSAGTTKAALLAMVLSGEALLYQESKAKSAKAIVDQNTAGWTCVNIEKCTCIGN